MVCNRLINPHDLRDGGSEVGEVLRTPRPDPPGWEERRDLVRAMHAEIRGDLPGWGRTSVTALEVDLAARVAAFQAGTAPADVIDALRGAIGA